MTATDADPGTEADTDTDSRPAAPRPGFEQVSAVEVLDDGTFSGTVSGRWTIGGKPNGGYLLAMLGRAATALTEQDHVVAASAHYLRPPDPGPVVVAARVLRAGRTASQVRATLSQDGRDCVEALITVGHLDPDAAPYWSAGLPEPASASDDEGLSFENGVPLTGPTPSGIDVALLDEVSIRLARSSTGFLTGRPTGRGELLGWLELPGGEPFGPHSLLFAVDAFPPATFDIAPSGWVPTFELTAYVRALPAPGPVRVLQRAQLIDGGLLDEACFVWDSTGRLVAQGTQLAGIRIG
jgi:hypothetical protein